MLLVRKYENLFINSKMEKQFFQDSHMKNKERDVFHIFNLFYDNIFQYWILSKFWLFCRCEINYLSTWDSTSNGPNVMKYAFIFPNDPIPNLNYLYIIIKRFLIKNHLRRIERKFFHTKDSINENHDVHFSMLPEW